MRNEVDIAWAAGLFEGEGCITHQVSYKNSSPYRSTRLSLTSTDHDVVLRFSDIVGVGRIDRREPHGKNIKPTYTWTMAGKKRCQPILRMFLPFLGERRKQRAFEELVSMERVSSYRYPGTQLELL